LIDLLIDLLIDWSLIQQLWSLVVENADFLLHLRTMKEFYLLGRGELFLTFIDKANFMLCVPPTTITKHGLFNATMLTVMLGKEYSN